MKRKKLRQFDVANAFLYAPIDAETFVEQPHGSDTDPYQVCQLVKSLYGIKQALRLWKQYLHARLIRIGFQQIPHDQGMYRLTKEAEYILLIMHVDDLLYIGSTDGITNWFEGELQQDLSLTVSSTAPWPIGLSAPATAANAATACCTTMASLRVLALDHEGRPVQFDTWLDDLQLYLLSDSKDSVSLFDLASGAAAAPPDTADSATRSQWLTRDAGARLAIRNHLPLAECAHFGQHRTAQALYDAVVAR
ncbi:unnamed protein product [Closterium sp. NIES-54]